MNVDAFLWASNSVPYILAVVLAHHGTPIAQTNVEASIGH